MLGRWPVGADHAGQLARRAPDFHPVAHVDTLQGLARYPFPNLAASDVDAGLEKKVRKLQADGYTVLGQMSQTILATAYSMRGIP